MIIRSKDENNEAIRRGLLGNSLRNWVTKDELRAAVEQGYNLPVGIRSLRPGGLFECPRTVQEALATTRTECYFTEWISDDHRLIQGEIRQSERHLDFFYTREPEPMRPALLKVVPLDSHYYGLMALEVLRHYLWPSSFEDVMELLTLYPDHVIELSIFDCQVGPNRGRNAIIWEVRNY